MMFAVLNSSFTFYFINVNMIEMMNMVQNMNVRHVYFIGSKIYCFINDVYISVKISYCLGNMVNLNKDFLNQSSNWPCFFVLNNNNVCYYFFSLNGSHYSFVFIYRFDDTNYNEVKISYCLGNMVNLNRDFWSLNSEEPYVFECFNRNFDLDDCLN